MSSKSIIKEDAKREDLKLKEPRRENNIICWNFCKNIINLEEYFHKINPFKTAKNLTDNLSDHKNNIDEMIKKIEILKREPLRRKDLEDTILFDKWNKKWGIAIVKEAHKSFVYQIKKKWIGKYIVFLGKKKPINYKEFYEKFKNEGLLRGKENIISELRNRFQGKIKDQKESSQVIFSNDINMLSN